MDKLDKLFKYQFDLLNKYVNKQTSCSLDYLISFLDDSKQRLITDTCNFIAEESFELKRCFNYKAWKPLFEPKVDEAKEELIDIMHFVLQAAILLGMNSNDFLVAFEKKNLKNHKREDEGYSENY